MNKILLIFLLILHISVFVVAAEEELTQEEWRGAEKILKEMLAKKPDDPKIYQGLGHIYMKLEEWEKAREYFKKAVSLDPKLYMSWYNLAILDIDNETGYNYFKKAVEANPNFPTPYYWMAYYHCRLKEDEKAIPLFEKFLEIAGDDPNEAGRVSVTKEVLQDLRAGVEGQSLSMMRKPFYEEDIPFYMAIIGTAKTRKKAEELARALIEKPGVVYSGDWCYPMDGSVGAGIGIYETKLWKGLEPGYFVIADGLFVSMKEAEELRAKIKPAIPDVYIKKVVNPRIEEILFVGEDKSWVIWSGLGIADFEEFHFTNLKEEEDIKLCSGRRIPPRGKMMMHFFDPEIEPLTVDRKEGCFYFYDSGFKVFYFSADKPRDAYISRKTVIKIENAVRKEIGDPEADVKVRWVIGDKACASVNEPLKEEEAMALTDIQHHKRTLFNLKLKDSTWTVVSKRQQTYEVTTVCYH